MLINISNNIIKNRTYTILNPFIHICIYTSLYVPRYISLYIPMYIVLYIPIYIYISHYYLPDSASITSGAIQQGVPVNVDRSFLLVPPSINVPATPKSANSTLPRGMGREEEEE